MDYKFGSNVLPSERRPVSWYSPPVLLQAGRELVSSVDFLRNSDRRELFEGEIELIDFAASPHRYHSFDFIADTGDGGNATFTLAEAALRRELEATRRDKNGKVEKLLFERPPLVVFGGDLAYPGASSHDYHYRLLEPYSLARPPQSAADPQRAWHDVLAIPQNHDWFDSTTTFCRYFVGRTQSRPTEFVDAYAKQQRTYFVARLPHRWWIVGLDFALKGDIDRKQFRDICTLWAPDRQGPRIEPGDNVILVYPEPYWTRKLAHGCPEGYTTRYQRLEHLLEADPGPTRETHGAKARIRLRLAGDLHHYCRHYTSDGAYAESTNRSTHLVTCGSGGAFMHTTHGPEVQRDKFIDRSPEHRTEPPSLGLRTRVGLKDKTLCNMQQATILDKKICYPTASRSRYLAFTSLIFSILGRPNVSDPAPPKLSKIFGQLWDSNLGFALCLGFLYGFNAYVNSIAFSESYWLDDFGPMHTYSFNGVLAYDWVRAMFFSPFATLVNVVMIAGCVRIAWEGTWPGFCKFVGGVLHGIVHGVAICIIYFAAAKLANGIEPSLAPLARGLLTWVLVTALGCVVGALIFGVYFAVMNGFFGQLTNNASGAIAVQDYKGFLRFKITPDHLEATYLACDRVPRKWQLDGDGRITVKGDPPEWRVKDQFTLKH